MYAAAGRFANVSDDLQSAKGAKTWEKAEDPIFALENNLPIDFQHYLEHHLEKPLMRIFEPIMRNPKSLLSGVLRLHCYVPAYFQWKVLSTCAFVRSIRCHETCITICVV